MKRIFTPLIGTLLAATALPAAAQKRLLDFDGTTAPSTLVAPIKDGYGRKDFLWGRQAGDWGVVRGPTWGCNSQRGVVSKQRAAYNHAGQDVDWFTKTRKTTFNLISAFLTPWYYDPLVSTSSHECTGYGTPFEMSVLAYRKGQLVGQQTFVLDDTTATKYQFNFMNIDSLSFRTTPGVQGDSAWFMMDDARVRPFAGTGAAGVGASAVAPEPVSMLLLGTGLAGVGAAARRRRRREQENQRAAGTGSDPLAGE